MYVKSLVKLADGGHAISITLAKFNTFMLIFILTIGKIDYSIVITKCLDNFLIILFKRER